MGGNDRGVVDWLLAGDPSIRWQVLDGLLNASHGLLGSGYCTSHPSWTPPAKRACSSRPSIEFRPTLKAQHDDATNEGQYHRADLFQRLHTYLNENQAP